MLDNIEIGEGGVGVLLIESRGQDSLRRWHLSQVLIDKMIRESGLVVGTASAKALR